MIFLCGSIVCLCGFDFILEVANLLEFAIDTYLSAPFPYSFVEIDALIAKFLWIKL